MGTIAIVANNFLLLILKKCEKGFHSMDRFLIFQTQNSVCMDTISIVANNFLLLILKTCEKGLHLMDCF
jgi:hypothetical protein